MSNLATHYPPFHPPHPPCVQAAGVQGSSATYTALCEVFQQQGKWDKLRTAVQVKGEHGQALHAAGMTISRVA